MDTTGNVLIIVGTIITFWAYFAGQRQLTLRELEPGLTTLGQRARVRVRRLFGLPGKNATINAPTALAVAAAMSASARVWSPIAATDTIDERVEKLARNLDTLVSDVDEFRQATVTKIADVHRVASDRMARIEADIAARNEAEREAETEAARWEIRGLLLVLVGTVLTSFG